MECMGPAGQAVQTRTVPYLAIIGLPRLLLPAMMGRVAVEAAAVDPAPVPGCMNHVWPKILEATI
jgi:hypothetical protein